MRYWLTVKFSALDGSLGGNPLLPALPITPHRFDIAW